MLLSSLNKILFLLIIPIILLISNSCAGFEFGGKATKDSTKVNIPPELRFIRIYGEINEKNPPILQIRDEKNMYSVATAFEYLTLEFDISANVPPAMYVRYVHCDVNWNETENAFIQNAITNRTTIIDWTSATFLDDYYSYRGKVKVPGPTNKFEYSGNYKAVLYLMDNDSVPFGECRFFVVKPQASSRLLMYTDFYDIQYKVTNTGFILETIVTSQEPFFDDRMHSVVYYRMNRYYEPFVCSRDRNIDNYAYLYNFTLRTMISGFSSYEKRFRLEGVPAENGYRVLNMTNTAVFPRSNDPIRLPLSDISRGGSFNERDDDGVMVSDFVGSSNDDYVYLEFVFDPESYLTTKDVFISGSFNNWKPDRSWLMYYDEKNRLYKCRNWVKRARHNYLYGLGTFNQEKNRLEKFSFDYYEGNTAYSGHTYLAFVYYRQVELGAYDSIISVVSSSNY